MSFDPSCGVSRGLSQRTYRNRLVLVPRVDLKKQMTHTHLSAQARPVQRCSATWQFSRALRELIGNRSQ